MSLTETTPPRPAGLSAARPAVVAAAIGSAAAGLVHGAAAGSHQGDSMLVWMFAACAAAQLGWGWAVAVNPRPSRSLLLTGLVINGGAVLVWAASRTVGISFIASLKVREEVGTQDLTCALFAALSVAAIVWILLRPDVRAVLPPGWPAAVAVGAFLLALPALAAGHSHTLAGHDHLTTGDEAAAEHSHVATLAAAEDAHDHSADATTASSEEHAHSSDDTTTSADAPEHAAHSTAVS